MDFKWNYFFVSVNWGLSVPIFFVRMAETDYSEEEPSLVSFQIYAVVIFTHCLRYPYKILYKLNIDVSLGEDFFVDGYKHVFKLFVSNCECSVYCRFSFEHVYLLNIGYLHFAIYDFRITRQKASHENIRRTKTGHYRWFEKLVFSLLCILYNCLVAVAKNTSLYTRHCYLLYLKSKLCKIHFGV